MFTVIFLTTMHDHKNFAACFVSFMNFFAINSVYQPSLSGLSGLFMVIALVKQLIFRFFPSEARVLISDARKNISVSKSILRNHAQAIIQNASNLRHNHGLMVRDLNSTIWNRQRINHNKYGSEA